MSELEKQWAKATVAERYRFLLYLDKAYGFGRLCRGVIGMDKCWFYKDVKEKLGQKEN